MSEQVEQTARAVVERRMVHVRLLLSLDDVARVLAVSNPDAEQMLAELTRMHHGNGYQIRRAVEGMVQSVLGLHATAAREGPGALQVSDRHRELVTHAFGFAHEPVYRETDHATMVAVFREFERWLHEPGTHRTHRDTTFAVPMGSHRAVMFYGHGVAVVTPMGWDCDGFAPGEPDRMLAAMAEAFEGTAHQADSTWNGAVGTDTCSVAVKDR